jgi:hypothetical protein
MSDQVQALLTEADKLAAVAEAIGRAYATELARVLRDLERQLRQLAAAALEGSQTALARAVRAAKLRKELQRALNAAGYAHLTETATTGSLDALLVQMAAVRGAAKLAAFTASDQTRILALKKLAEIDLLGAGDELAHALWRTLAQGLYSQRAISDLMADLADAVDVEESRLRTLYDTTVSIFTRQVEALKSTNTPEEVFAYIGPVDAKLRPFCRAHVGKVYDRKAIDAMDNGQLPNVFLTGGGYNCRHTWQAVSKFSELRNLLGTGARIPEVATAVSRVPVGGTRAA